MNNQGQSQSSLSAKWSDFVSKSTNAATSSNIYQNLNSSRSTAPAAATSTNDLESAAAPSSFSEQLSSGMTRAREFVIGRPEPEPQGWLSIFNCLSNDKSYTYALVAFACSGLFGLLCFALLATIVLMPAKFVMCFTLSVLFAMVGLAFLNGPRMYVKKMFIETQLIASIVLFVSLGGSLWFSMIQQSYILSLVFCAIELNALMFYCCKTSAANAGTIRWLGSGVMTSIKGIFTRQ